MTLKITQKGLSFNSVSAGATATARLPIGRTYQAMMINYGGLTLAQMNRITLKIGTTTLFELGTRGGKSAGQRLDAHNKFKGRSAAAGGLILSFTRFGIRARIAEELTKLGTGLPNDPNPIKEIFCEIEIDGAAINPTLSSKMIMSQPSESGLLLYTTDTQRKTLVGEAEISDLPIDKYDAIQSIVFENATALGINRVVIKRDDVTVFDRTKAENDQFQTDGVRVPIADSFIFDPAEEGHGEERLDLVGVQALQIYIYATAAGTTPMIVEYLAGAK